MVPWFQDALPRCQGASVPWCHGATTAMHCASIVPWCHDARAVPWCHSAMMSWCHSAIMLPCFFHAATLPWFHGAKLPWCHGTMMSGSAIVPGATSQCQGNTVPTNHSTSAPWHQDAKVSGDHSAKCQGIGLLGVWFRLHFFLCFCLWFDCNDHSLQHLRAFLVLLQACSNEHSASVQWCRARCVSDHHFATVPSCQEGSRLDMVQGWSWL